MEVVWSSIRRRLGEVPDRVFLLVKASSVKGSPADLVADVEWAIGVANLALVEPNGEEPTKADPHCIPSLKGPMVHLGSVWSDEDTQKWLDVFASELSAAGRDGTVTAAPVTWPPRTFNDAMKANPPLTTWLAYTLTIPEQPLPPETTPPWLLPESVTKDVCRHAVDWGAFPGATIYLAQSISSFKVQDPDVTDALVRSLSGIGPDTGVLYIAPDASRYAATYLWSTAQVVHSNRGPGPGWSHDIDQAKAALLRTPDLLDIGFIRRHPYTPMSWVDLGSGTPRLPFTDEPGVRYNRQLLSRLVPDAHAIQVLTRTHLERAHDLTTWTTTKLDHNHYLVEARDLESWFTHQTPHEDVLDQARADFGAMIMTPETILAEPDGWVQSSGRPFQFP